MAKDYESLNVLESKAVKLRRAIYDKGYEQGYKDGQAQQIASDDVFMESCEKAAYEKGLNDIWEWAKKIVCYIQYGGLGDYHLREIFGTSSYCKIFLDNSPSEVIAKLKEYEEKQKAKDEIKVGDRVRILKDKDLFGHTVSPIGTIGTVSRVYSDTTLPYFIDNVEDNACGWYSRDMFEVITDEIIVGDEVYLSSLSKDYPRVVLSLYTENDGLGQKARTMLAGGTIDIKPVSELKRTGKYFSQISEILKQMGE